MNKKKIIIILEFLFIITICKIIYDGFLLPIMLKSENSFAKFFQGTVGNFIGWVIIATIISVIYELVIKPLIKKAFKRKN